MAWFKVDDKLHSSRKVMRIPRRHRLAAVGLWTIAGSWSSDQLTDGLVPDYMIEEWGGTPAIVEALVKVGLWQRVDGESGNSGREFENSSVEFGNSDVEFQFSNWDEYQPTKADVEDGRRKNAEKLRKWRERNRVTDSDVTGVHDGYEPERNPAPDPTRPDPTPTTSNEVVTTSDVADAPTRPDVDRICQHLADRIEGNGSKRPTITKTWTDEARRLIDIDKRTVDQILLAIDWCQDDAFWRSNVLSMPALRKKYDQLRLAAQRETAPKRPVDRQGDLLKAEMAAALAFDQAQDRLEINA